jgi:serine/threonine protein kinase
VTGRHSEPARTLIACHLLDESKPAPGELLAHAPPVVTSDAFASTAAEGSFDALIADEQATGALGIGEIVADSYVIRSVLGAGGMGQVYAADEIELRRPVAIKTNRVDDLGRLLTEAQALAQVHHRNIVAIHRFGRHRGVPFLVMERLYGRSLADHIGARQLTGRPTEVLEALELLHGIAAGLDALHAATIAHLDLKPGNVMVCAEHRVVLVDLGVMVPEVTAGPRRPCGTPLYMAPELIEGVLERGRANRADLYAFGALAFELLTGQPLFTQIDPVEIMYSHLVDQPKEVRVLRPEVPERLSRLVAMCLAKNPDDRPHGALEVSWELRAIQTLEQKRWSKR